MSTNIIPPPPAPTANTPFDAIREVRDDGTEFWSARELMTPLGYDRWENFTSSVDRARAAARAHGNNPADHFRGAAKVIEGGRWGTQTVSDYELTRFGAYLVAMNGDPRKSEVAAAQAYFAIRTREAEVREQPKQLSEAEIVAQALQITTRRVEELEAKVTADAPKVDYVDDYVADGDLRTLRHVASSLNVGEEWLRNLLVQREWIYVESATRWSEKDECKKTTRRYSAYAHKRGYFTAVPNHEAPRFPAARGHHRMHRPPLAVDQCDVAGAEGFGGDRVGHEARLRIGRCTTESWYREPSTPRKSAPQALALGDTACVHDV